MPPGQEFGHEEWTVGVRVWLERAGVPVLGKGRLELLEAIALKQSISAAARLLKISYRHAWLLVRATNDSAAEPLVSSTTGGKMGGGARITPYGQKVLKLFRDLQADVDQTAALHWQRLVGKEVETAIVIFAAVSLEDALPRVLREYQQRMPGDRIRAIYGASDALADQLLAGAYADVFISANKKQVDRLEEAGLIDPSSRTPLAKNRLAGIGSGTIAIRGPGGLAHPRVQRLALADPRCPLGAYSQAFLRGLKIYEELVSRIEFVDNSRAVLKAVCSGQADAGLVYASDAAQAAGSRVLFHASASSMPIVYEGALMSRGPHRAVVRDFLRFLQSSAGRIRW
jgi:molybdate transport system substrate-binding protein